MDSFDGDDEDLKPARVSRRPLVAVGLAAVALSAGGVLAYRSRAASRREQAAGLAREAYVKLRGGAVGAALKLATDARALDPDGREPAFAWLHATGFSLLEDTGGSREAVGFVDEVRRLGAAGTDLGFCVLAAAVAMRNDKLAGRIVAQHDVQRLVPDAFYWFARGAARDLCCERDAAECYQASADLWADALLPRLRVARSHVLRGRFAEAREALKPLPDQDVGRLVLECAAARLEDRRVHTAAFGSAALDEAPRSLRPLGLSLLVRPDDPSAAIDAALDDVDSPLAAVVCGKLALLSGDVASAQSAAEHAVQSRPELTEAADFAVRVALVRGDLDRARQLADETRDPGTTSLVSAISAYEDKSPEKIREAVEAAMESGGTPWRLAGEARGVLGDGPAPTVVVPKGEPTPPLWVALEAGEPWADVVMFDAAFVAGDLKTCQAVLDRWREPTQPREKRRALLLGKRAGG